MGEADSEASFWSQDASALAWAVGAGPVGLTPHRAAAPPTDVGLASLSADYHISGDPTHGWIDRA